MQTTIQYIKSELDGVYPDSEVQGLIRIIVEWITGWNYTQQLYYRDTLIHKSVQQKIVPIIKRLKKYEPIQYILGETEFFGLKLKVTPAVLIPRPETEELVKLILDKNKITSPGILDIGTGSGCIALALKNNLKKAIICGVDVSAAALEIAKENAQLNQLEVEFVKADILQWEEFDWRVYDIIVSNPPYVTESEKMQMQNNVLDYEPRAALFVPDNDPLFFYRKIAEYSIEKLNKNGLLFFEINEKFGFEMYELLIGFGFRNVELFDDINGKKRMISGLK